MSRVTDYIFMHSISEQETSSDSDIYVAVKCLNEILSSRFNSLVTFAPVWQLSVAEGGDKVYVSPVYLLAGNYVEPEAVIEIISAVAWEYPEDVQLLWKGEEDGRFTLFNLGDAK